MDRTQVRVVAEVRRLARTGAARRVRLDARTSLREIAGPTGVHASTISRWECARAVPRADAALRWAAVLRELGADV